MTVRELLRALVEHATDGRTLNEEILVRTNGDVREIEASYSHGVFILVAGQVVSGS